MVQNIPRREEQRGFSRLFLWGLVAAAVIAVIAIGGPILTNVYTADKAGLEGTTKTPSEAANEASTPDTTVAALGVKESSEYGTFLTDGEGRALYLFEGDEQGQGDRPAVSTCYEDCAKVWPPLTSADTPRVVSEVDEALLGTVERRDGTKQITYNGWPLYHFTKDFGPQEATGQDVEDFGAEWYLLTPAGEKVGHDAEGTG